MSRTLPAHNAVPADRPDAAQPTCLATDRFKEVLSAVRPELTRFVPRPLPGTSEPSIDSLAKLARNADEWLSRLDTLDESGHVTRVGHLGNGWSRSTACPSLDSVSGLVAIRIALGAAPRGATGVIDSGGDGR